MNQLQIKIFKNKLYRAFSKLDNEGLLLVQEVLAQVEYEKGIKKHISNERYY